MIIIIIIVVQIMIIIAYLGRRAPEPLDIEFWRLDAGRSANNEFIMHARGFPEYC